MGVDFIRRGLVLCLRSLAWLSLALSFCVAPGWSQTSTSRGQRAQPQPAGSIAGKVVDQSGIEIAGAIVKFSREGEPSRPDVITDGDGRFVFTHVAAGPFKLTVSSLGLTPRDFSGSLASGEHYETPLIMMIIPTQVTEIHVGLPPEEVANAEIKQQESQRAFGFIPNFYTSFVPNAAPLKAKHKFGLAWKSASDPVTLVGVGFLAGIDQAAGRWSGYGGGMQGYAKRYGATYADVFSATFIGGAVMPTILKQDPRYFYKGTGSKRSRILYALGSSIMCKGDNGRWQPNYSDVTGSFAAGGLAYLYYPKKDRTAGLVISSAFIRLGETSLAGILQEFVFPRFTPNRPTRSARPSAPENNSGQ
jgi:Carboxypeptidase regulatory-like domain